MLKNLQTYIPDRVHETALTLNESIRFIGHKAFVEGVSFHPMNENELCSVSIDKQIMLWDCRTSDHPINIINDVHYSDINCLDWSKENENLIATGSSDKTVAIIDRRKVFTYNQLKSLIVFPHEDEVN